MQAFHPGKLAYELRIKQKYPDSWKEFLQSHKFTGGHGACHFMASFTKKRLSKAKGKTMDSEGDDWSNSWKLVPARTLLQHSPHCNVVGKIKSRQLIANPGFRSQVVANGKASCNQLTRYEYVSLLVSDCISTISEPRFT